jgi:G3E family GTPase
MAAFGFAVGKHCRYANDGFGSSAACCGAASTDSRCEERPVDLIVTSPALVNDFGAINVDAKLIVSVEGETVSMVNGCVCCTIRDDLLIEVERLLASENPPEHIVIETSGVSKPVSVAETFINPSVQSFVDVRIIVVLGALLAFDEQAEYHNLAIDHIRLADLVVINKTDLVTPQQLSDLKQKVESIAGLSRIWETSFGERRFLGRKCEY